MADVQIHNGNYTRVANTTLEKLAKIKLPPESTRIVYVIWRQTYGYNHRSAMITLDKFAEKTGLKKPNIIRAIKVLVAMKIIIKNDNGKYAFEKDYEKWIELSKMITVNNRYQKRERVLSKMIIPVIKNDNALIKDTIKDTSKDIKTILSQAETLLATLSENLRWLFHEFIHLCAQENKSKQLAPSRKAREIFELYQLYKQVEPDRPGLFEKALLITCNKQAPNINYIKAIIKRMGVHESYLPPDCKSVAELKSWRTSHGGHQ